MKYYRLVAILALTYALIVLALEATIWKVQPNMEGGVTIIVQSDDGNDIERHLFGYEFEGNFYVSSNHWFRSWYYQALKQPQIEVIRENLRKPYKAIKVIGEEHEKLSRDYTMGFVLRLICGFAPSKFLRLEASS